MSQFLKENLDQFVDVFYEDFFNNTEEIAKVFRNTSLTMQKEELKNGLKTILEKQDNQNELNSYLEDLGVRHVAYEVRPHHYENVKRSLLYSFKTIHEGSWSEELEKEYSSLINHICTRMMLGAEKLDKKAS